MKKEKTSDYYRGQRDLWKKSYNMAAQKLFNLESDFTNQGKQVKEMGNTIEQLERERERLQMDIQSKDHNLERYKDCVTDKEAAMGQVEDQLAVSEKKFADLLEWCMSIDNRSAEERLRCIRSEYKDQWEVIKPQKKAAPNERGE